MSTVSIVMQCGVVLSLCAAQASAGVAYQPPDIGDGDEYRLVFVTSVGHGAADDEISVYNDFVQSVADASDLAVTGLTWKVIGSVGGFDARDNTGTNPLTDGVGVPIYNLAGQLVASGNADLWDGTLVNPISINENGLGTSSVVYTGSEADGTFHSGAPLGDNPGFDTELAITGFSTATDSGWINLSGDDEDVEHAFYAMSTIRVGVPAPGTATLVGAGALVLVRRRRSPACQPC